MNLAQWIIQQDQARLDFIRKYDKEGWSPIEDITHLPFISIKRDIPQLIQEGKFDKAISLVLSKKEKDILSIEPLDRFRLLIWIEKQYEKINKMEDIYLSSTPDMKLIAAGIKDLDVLGIINVVDLLANGDVTKWAEIEQLPYSKCFEKQLKLNIEKRIQDKIIEQNKSKK